MAELFIDAMLSSADVDTIGVTSWWDRAKTALETAAASSTSWPQCVSRAAKKLQIETLSPQSSQTIAELATVLDDPQTFAAWARLAARDAVYTVALVRAAREQRREQAKRDKTPKTTTAAPALADDQPLF